MKKTVQRSMHCGCGNEQILAHGLCATCYTLKRQDEKYFGGLREDVLKRDGYRCRVCAELPEGKRLCIGLPPCVHHRVPGISKLHLMITLCPGHHAMVTRTLVLYSPVEWPELLRLLWREQHPDGHEQTMIAFARKLPASVPVPLFRTEDD